MKISTEIGSLRNAFGTYEKVLDAVKSTGFDAYDFSMFEYNVCPWINEDDYAEKAKKLRKYADGIGLVCNQTHSPFPLVFVGDEKRTEERFFEIVRALEISSILGAEFSVVHPWNGYSPQENEKIYKRIEPYAKKFGVKIALENMWFWDRENNHALPAACSDGANFNAHLNLLNGEIFCALLDIGHAEMKGLDTSAPKMIRELGDRLKGIHLHDNDLRYDSHTLPFTGAINYKPIIAALKETGYNGDITLECSNFVPSFPQELAFSALKIMADAANYFRSELQK